MWFDFNVKGNIEHTVSFIDEHTLIGQYIQYYKFSRFKNLFEKNVNVTIDHSKTINDIKRIFDDINIKYENDKIITNNVDDILLKLIFNFYGWKKEDVAYLPMYEIIDPYEWIKDHNDIGKRETMYFNDTNLSYHQLYKRIWSNPMLRMNVNIFFDYCYYDKKFESIFKDLYNKDISIDALSTIEQVRYYYPDIIYNYDDQYINIRRIKMNKWNTPLEMLFKFYGWYPKDDMTLYPKYEILDLNKYIENHR